METILQLKNVYANYNGKHVLEDVSLTMKQGEFLSIIGPNGGGKTTLIKAVLGLVKPCGGEIWIRKDLVMGYVPQHTQFDRRFPINVFDAVLLGRLGNGIKMFRKFSQEDKNRVEEVLERMGLTSIAKRQIGTLSGGQLQKVLVARALATEPDLLVLDEPTANLDADNKREIYNLLHGFNGVNSIILVTHDLEYLEDNKRQVVLLDRKILYKGDSKTRKKVQQSGGVLRHD